LPANSSWVHPLNLRKYFRFFPAVDIANLFSHKITNIFNNTKK
jgi:hypothetical protein